MELKEGGFLQELTARVTIRIKCNKKVTIHYICSLIFGI